MAVQYWEGHEFSLHLGNISKLWLCPVPWEFVQGLGLSEVTTGASCGLPWCWGGDSSLGGLSLAVEIFTAVNNEPKS